MAVSSGLDVVLSHDLGSLSGSGIGLITSRSAVTCELVPGIDALLAAGADVRAVLVPEHGLQGDFAAGADVPSSVDETTGIPIHSLYGATRKPTEQMLSGIDVLVFDIQDVGARFYTYLYTMAYAMQSAAEQGIPIWVLDRPNPIGGVAVEGPVLDPAFSSFVGLYPIPIRTGMTIGELALLFNSEFGISADLSVVRLDSWQRKMWFDETGLAWVPPSPGIPDLRTAIVYPGMCLLEGTNMSEGRGTAEPFLQVGAPWVDGRLLAAELAHAALPGVDWEPVWFTPIISKHAVEECEGVRAVVTDRESFRPVLSGLKLIELAAGMFAGHFRFNPPGQDGRYFFDLLAGTDKVRILLESGAQAEEILRDLAPLEFLPSRDKYLIYI